MIYLERKIKDKIQALFEKSEKIHISFSQTKPKISVKDAEASIVGVYAHFFRIELFLNGLKQYYSIRYADILPNHITITELEGQ